MRPAGSNIKSRTPPVLMPRRMKRSRNKSIDPAGLKIRLRAWEIRKPQGESSSPGGFLADESLTPTRGLSWVRALRAGSADLKLVIDPPIRQGLPTAP